LFGVDFVDLFPSLVFLTIKSVLTFVVELEDKMVEITSEEQNKVRRTKRTEDSLRDLWDNIKSTNI